MNDDPHHGFPDGGAPALRDGISASGSGLLPPALQEPSRVELLARVAALESKLTTLPAIEQAKGALMVAYGITADVAFTQLRFHSQNQNVKVRAIAAQLITMLCDSPSSTAITRVERFLGRRSPTRTTTGLTGPSSLPGRPQRVGPIAAE